MKRRVFGKGDRREWKGKERRGERRIVESVERRVENRE